LKIFARIDQILGSTSLGEAGLAAAYQFIRPVFTLSLLIAIFLLSASPKTTHAQEDQPPGPVYIVQENDTLWQIAQRFRLSVQQLVAANHLSDPNQLPVGSSLIIPGLEGISGRLVTVPVPYGETVRSLAVRYQTTVGILNRLNDLVSPKQAHVGFNMIVPENSTREGAVGRVSIKPGQSFLELAVVYGENPYKMASHNSLSGPSAAISKDIYFLEGKGGEGPGALPLDVRSVQLDPQIFTQGKTAVMRVETDGEAVLSGTLLGSRLKFFGGEPGEYFSLQGIHALQAPGSYLVEIEIQQSEGTYYFSQMVYVRSGSYPQAPDLKVDEAGLDASITEPEDARWLALAEPGTPERLWDVNMEFPSPRIYLGQYTSRFGERRTYNNNPQIFYHTGLDIPGQTGTEVFAPAPGRVVFAEHLDVRGHSVIINHGWGVYTAFMHLSEYKISKGDWVDTGQVIALVGNTGLRTTGSHLHWEVIVGGVQVDPLEWMERKFP
jgi:murein DD-endopeptidase MepM/ murein hydrolase activator NlpD